MNEASPHTGQNGHPQKIYKCWRECRERGALPLWWECKLVHPLQRTVWRFLKKLKIELPYDLAIPHLGIYSEKIIIWKESCTPVFTGALFTIAGHGSNLNVRREMDTENVVHVAMEYYSSIKNNEIMSFTAPWMDPEIIILSKSDRERQVSHDITHIWNLKKVTNELIYKTKIELHM